VRLAAMGSLVDPTMYIATADLSLDDEGRDLWDEVLPHLPQALAGSDTAFLGALEAAGRGAGLTQRVPVAALLDAYSRGSEQLRELLLRGDALDAERKTRRLLGFEHAALTRLSAGYAGGLQETIDQLRRLADESSPVDADSGAMKPGEFGERLSLEVERCQRMDLPLGLVELAVDGGGERRSGGGGYTMLHEVGTCLRETLRRYDSVGLTQDGGFVLVLPDISRRGLAGAAERIRRQVDACAGRGDAPELTFALAHYDFVDASATEMLDVLGRGLREAKVTRQPLAWV
jgi:GGDEF domain-containing protein